MNSASMQQTAFMLKTARTLYVNLVVNLVRRIKKWNEKTARGNDAHIENLHAISLAGITMNC